MTKLRQRFIEDLQLRHLSPRTIEAYIFHVRKLASHFGKPPDDISDEELRAYFLHIRNIQNWSRTAIKIALCAIKRFYVYTLDKPWPAVRIVLPKKEKKIPPILSIEEVHRILNQLHCDDGKVTFRYRPTGSAASQTMTLEVFEFIRRFLQHILPKGFQKVRYFGFLHPKNKRLLFRIKLLLKPLHETLIPQIRKNAGLRCPECGKPMIPRQIPNRKRAPPEKPSGLFANC